MKLLKRIRKQTKKFRKIWLVYLILPILFLSGVTYGVANRNIREVEPTPEPVKVKPVEEKPKPKQEAPKPKPQPKPEPAPQPEPPKPAYSPPTNHVLVLVNQVRARAGLSPLQESSVLNGSATRSANAQIRTGTCCSHGDWQQWFYGLGFSFYGENIAACQQSDEELVNAWVKSPTHYANIVDTRYTHFGIGLVYGNFTGPYSGGKIITCRYATNHFGVY